MGKFKDLYVNTAYGKVTESAAGTLTFSEIPTNVSVFEKLGWILTRIEWFVPPATSALLVANDDLIHMALTASDNLNALLLNAPAVVDYHLFEASEVLRGQPLIRDFSTLPGGGKIIAPRPLYVAIKSASLATPASVETRISFTQKELAADEYLELVDFFRIVQ